LTDLIRLSTDNFVALPSAFLSRGYFPSQSHFPCPTHSNLSDIPITSADKWQKLSILPKFVEKVAAFTDTVFAKVKQRYAEVDSRGTSIFVIFIFFFFFF
jgi:hypothetical protein